jgi:hypothetical protein
MMLRCQLETQQHDWLADDRLARVLAPLRAWFGDVAWFETNWKGKRRPRAIPRGATQHTEISGMVARDGKPGALDVGGDGWELHLLLAPYDAGADALRGMNLVTLDVERPDDDPNDADSFVAATTSGLVDYGYLAPREQEERLRREAEPDPILADQVFPCVQWCTYLSSGLVVEFDRARLGDLAPARAAWRDDGLVLVTAATAAAATSPEGADAMRALTATFRAARRS